MVNHFNNRKSEPVSKHQSVARPMDAVRNLKFLFDPSSKRGQRWRFRILCLLAAIVAVYIYHLKNRTPHAGQDGFPDVIQRQDLLQRR